MAILGFFKRLLLTVVLTLLTLILVLAIAFGIARLALDKKPAIKSGSWLVLELDGDLLAYDPPGSMPASLLAGDSMTHQDALDAMGKAALDQRIEGVIWKLSSPQGAGWAKLQELRDGIDGVRNKGKPVYAWADILDLPALYLAAACDSVFQPGGGYCLIRGLRRESIHLREMLAKIGITPHVSKLRDYKSAAEMFTETAMTEPARDQAQRSLDGIWETVTTAIAAERGIERQDLLDLMERASMRPAEAAAAGLIDRTLYWQDLETRILADAGSEERTLPTVSAARYRSEDWSKFGPKGSKTVAVVHAQGMIGGKKNDVNPLMGLTMGHESIVRELRRARLDDDVDAIVLRVDSRGGDALTSDLIMHEVSLCAATKPIVASMVDVAASGGYMISYHATRVLANPLTVTGSIGSISAMFDLSDLYGRLGVNKDNVMVGPMAGMGNDMRPPTPDEWEAFVTAHTASYEDWLRDVAAKRGMSYETARNHADGRVFLGFEAAENGLIDGLGNLETAIREAANLAGIAPETHLETIHLPERRSMMEMVLGGGSAGESMSAWLRWQIYRLVHAEARATEQLLQAGMFH
jgi:protease IV